MDALAAALSPAPRRRRQLVALAAAGVASLLLIGRWLGAPQPCTGAPEQMTSVWNENVKATVQIAFGKSSHPGATESFRRPRI